MSKTLPMRLARHPDPGATLLNAYSYLVQIAGMYAHVAQFDHRPFGRKRWLELSDHILNDLGGLYATWEQALLDEKVVTALLADRKLYATVERQCRRTERLVRLLDMWTSSKQWVSVMTKLEKKWCVAAKALTVHVPEATDVLAQLIKASMERQSLLFGLAAQLANEAANYAEVAGVMRAQRSVK